MGWQGGLVVAGFQRVRPEPRDGATVEMLGMRQLGERTSMRVDEGGSEGIFQVEIGHFRTAPLEIPA